MTTEIEEALQAWAASLASATGMPPTFVTTVSGTSVKVSLHRNLASDVLPKDRPIIIFSCPEDGRRVGVLYTPVIKIAVATPQLASTNISGSLGAHRAAAQLAREWIVEANIPALSAQMLSKAGLICGGNPETGAGSFYSMPEEEAHGKTPDGIPQWSTILPVKLVLVKQS